MTDPMRPLRVAMLTQRYLPFTGGAEKQLAAVLRLLPDFGIEATVITRRHDASPMKDLVEGVPVSRIDLHGPRIYASLSYTAKAIRLLGQFRPDVVHAHELLSPSTTALAYKFLTRTPVVAKVLRGGSLGDIAALNASRSGRLRLPKIVAKTDAFAVISREIDNELAALGVPPDRRRFIPNGVDLTRFSPASTEEKGAIRERLSLPPGPTALFAGRLSHEKRIDRLVALWPRVRAVVPDATLIVAGTGDLAGPIGQKAGAGVILVGAREDLRDFYAAADSFILPSEAEGLSNALLEAMAMGLSCVATSVGAAPDLLGNGLGLLVNVDDDEGLRDAIIQSFRDLPRHRPGISRDLIAKDYSIEATARNLASLYRSLVK